MENGGARSHNGATAPDDARRMGDLDALVEAARAGRRLLVYPEGTLTRRPGLLDFKLGAFAAAAGVPVVPVTLRGTRSVLRGGQWFPRPGAVQVTVGPGSSRSGTVSTPRSPSATPPGRRSWPAVGSRISPARRPCWRTAERRRVLLPHHPARCEHTGSGQRAGRVRHLPRISACCGPDARATADRSPSRPILSRPAWWAPNGIAAIPTAALDPPHGAASPAVPALFGSGSPSRPSVASP